MAWYNASWLYRAPITIDSSANSAGLSYYHVHVVLSGAAFTAAAGHANVDGSDLRVTDSDGTTPLQFWLEGVDVTNSRIYILIKVPWLPNTGTKTIYLYYGNAGASSVSSALGAIRTVNAPASADVYVQADAANFNAYNSTVLLKNQTGGNAGRNGYILSSFTAGGDSNPSANAFLELVTSTDNGSSYSKTTLIAHTASHAHVNLSGLFEMADGTIIVAYGSDTNTNQLAATGNVFCAKSADGGATFNTGSATAVTTPFTSKWTAYGQFVQLSNGDLLWPWYGLDSGDTGWRSILMRCASGNDPSVGSNWVLKGGSKANATVLYNNVDHYYEQFLVLTTDDDHAYCVTRHEDDGDVYITYTSNLTSTTPTWSSPAALGLPTAGLTGGDACFVSPWVLKLASGAHALFLGYRDDVTGGGRFGIASLISTDAGTTWNTWAVGVPFSVSRTSLDRNSVGYPSPVQLPSGLILCHYYYQVSSGSVNLTNIAQFVTDEDYVANPQTWYDDLEAGFTNFYAHGANVGLDTTVKRGGAQSVLFNNSGSTHDGVSGGLGISAYREITDQVWRPTTLNRGALHCWIYPQAIFASGPMSTICPTDASGNFRLELDVWNTGGGSPYNPQWYDGALSNDLGALLPQNQWHKVSLNWSTPTGSTAAGIIHIDGVLKSAVVTQAAAGSDPQKVGFFCGSQASATGSYVNIDDLYMTQWAAHVPTYTLGAEQTQASPGAAANYYYQMAGVARV